MSAAEDTQLHVPEVRDGVSSGGSSKILTQGKRTQCVSERFSNTNGLFHFYHDLTDDLGDDLIDGLTHDLGGDLRSMQKHTESRDPTVPRRPVCRPPRRDEQEGFEACFFTSRPLENGVPRCILRSEIKKRFFFSHLSGVLGFRQRLLAVNERFLLYSESRSNEETLEEVR
ncbi:hypothetical protein NHX12_020759 [Muraenolepis orangiensis]|uniref:Uncharacterized protein n=1 Tax=Muraenolepis orangiensis TaxID=630683 RepID=A0A9Q0ESK4_9TELE|nr:hypothetical protein NHX12_020759 [Muraenolepis orangiensis]